MDRTETFVKIWDALKNAGVSYSGYSCNGVNLVGDAESIKAVMDKDYKIARLEAQVKRLEEQMETARKESVARSWKGEVDRMGGCFTDEEIARSRGDTW